MKFKNPNGQEYKVSPDKYRKRREKSKIATEARQLLEEKYPCEQILEEFPLKIGGQTLFADFFLPARNLIIEVDGKQHSEYNTFHYTNKLAFLNAKNRDKQKNDWCELNNIRLVRLNDGEQKFWGDLLG